MFERSDLIDAYAGCVDGAKEIASLCENMTRLGVHMGFFMSRQVAAQHNEIYKLSHDIAKYQRIPEFIKEAVAFRDKVQLVAIACRSLVKLTASTQELVERVKFRGRKKLLDRTDTETQALLTATLAQIRVKCDETLLLAEQLLKETATSNSESL